MTTEQNAGYFKPYATGLIVDELTRRSELSNGKHHAVNGVKVIARFSKFTDAELNAEVARRQPAEQPAPTREVNVDGITIRIPTGEVVGMAPTEKVVLIVDAIQDVTNWKLATGKFITKNMESAQAVAYGLDWFMGGHEMTTNEFGEITVTSKGYYHYVGI